ncbi:T9SS type A sorting domain-containing protein [Bacteroides salyersiae]|nr:T9SS type A sorting domain-containing protein [Bacteroides salyersiae]
MNSLVGENIKHDFSTVGIQSEHADQRLELASTIVTEELEILCDEDLDGAYIYTINGTRIMGVKIEGGKTLSVSGLESGYYIIAVYTKAGDAKIAKFLKK